MSSPLYALSEPIVTAAAAADYTAKKGYGVTLSGTTATVNASASTHHHGIIGEPGDTGEEVSVILPAGQVVFLPAGGTIAAWDGIVQHSDGTFITDPGSGARVSCGRALEAAVAGDLFRAQYQRPISLS